MRARIICLAGAAALLLVPAAGCKKSPTTSAPPTGLSVTLSPTSAAADTVVTMTISVSGNTKEIKAIAAQITFETNMFQFLDVAKGSLTSSWASVDGNDSGSGTVTLGGFAGSGTSVAANSNGTLAEVHLKVTGSNFANGQQVNVCLADFADDLGQFTSGSACAMFTLKK